MSYTILDARWGNLEKTSAVVRTAEVGHVAISFADTTEEWIAFLQWAKSNPVEDLPAPKAPPPPLTSEQKLGKMGLTIAELKTVLGLPP